VQQLSSRIDHRGVKAFLRLICFGHIFAEQPIENWQLKICHLPFGLESAADLARLIAPPGADLGMKKIKSPPRLPLPPLQAGQLWRMAEGDLRVGMVGKLLVHYKLGKADAVRVPNSCNGIKTIEKYLKAKKAVLV
jgi:hypothetical protein